MVRYSQWKHQTYLGAEWSPPVTRILPHCLPFNQIITALYLFMRILQILSPVCENPSSSPFRQQSSIKLVISPNKILHSFVPLFLLPSLVYRGFYANFSFPVGYSDTFSGQLFNLASSTVFLGNDVGAQLHFAINRYFVWLILLKLISTFLWGTLLFF